jgi:cellulose synthase/poly-beta-1,6-N-acetylglucosamine synthase-like glycosyltransferase
VTDLPDPGILWAVLFWIAVAASARGAVKMLVDWQGMRTTCAFVEAAYRRRPGLPDEAALEHDPRAPTFVHLVPAWQEPDIAGTLRAILAARYPHARLHVVVCTREEEERHPHPDMAAPTAELVRRLRAELPPWQQKMLSQVALPGRGRKAAQLNWALRPEVLRGLIGEGHDPARVWIGVSDADSIPDRDTWRWIAGDLRAGHRELAYQGVTLALANFERLDHRGRVCAIQQSSIFVRVSLARLINERRRVAWFARLRARRPRLAARLRPAFDFAFRRSQICLGHQQFVRLDVLQALGGFPAAGATEDSTLGYALGARGVLIAPLPLIELVDLPETTEKVIRQNARWYKGVLDDVAFLWRIWRAAPTAFNLAQLVRHTGNKALEWPVAALLYPVLGFCAWYLAYRFRDDPVWFVLGFGCSTFSLALTVWVAGISTQRLIERLAGHFPRPVVVARRTWRARFWGIFRSQTYWLLATRGAWRVLWSLARTGAFEPVKTDRVQRRG